MRGSITIKFNQATMIEAVQMYLDAQMTKPHVVTGVKQVSEGYPDSRAFEVEVSESDDPRT